MKQQNKELSTIMREIEQNEIIHKAKLIDLFYRRLPEDMNEENKINLIFWEFYGDEVMEFESDSY